MSRTYEGGCHCGAVRYQCTQEPEAAFNCYCNDCQKTTGSPFSVELMIRRDGFDCEGPTESYVVTGDSGKPVTRKFCRACGSGILVDCESDPDYVFVKAGTLDDSSWIKPEMHIFTSAKPPWFSITDPLPQFERMPPA